MELEKIPKTLPQQKTANEISADPEILKDMSQEDAHTIGYITATELMLKEKEQIKKLKNKENT